MSSENGVKNRFIPGQNPSELSVGQVAARCGVAISAIHYYEARGLIKSSRNPGNQRRYSRETLRRVAVVKAAQRLGIRLAAIRDAFEALPKGRTPTARDWARMSTRWRAELDERITKLIRLRDELSGCIGCGCLSLESCPLHNPDDELAKQGSGARLLEIP